jgi:signal transduction histidine kinase/DNA-binding LacI/PurR family transcriptional regulator
MMKDPAPSTLRRPIVGFLAARFDEAYQHAVWEGAATEAERLGADLVFFGGQRIRSPIGYEALDNIAYDLAGHGNLAGLIVMSNVIGTYISNEEQLEFLGRFRGMELVTVGIEFPGIENVRVEAAGGMRALARHLVKVHGRSRFVFLAGPAGHRESEARKEEFLRAIRELLPGAGGLPVLDGDFTEETARARILGFLDGGNRPDAVVAANDHMAFGAMGALAARGFDLPREVSVTGYDDTEDSRLSVPPLTTVRQPAAELGSLAMRRVAARLGLVEAGPAVHPPVSFVVRESCGCSQGTDGEEAGAWPEGEGGQAAGAAPGSPYGLPELTAEVDREVRAGRNPGWLRRRELAPALREQARALVAEGECRYLASRRLVADKRAAVLGEIEASLVSSFRVEDILGEVARGSRELGISACWLSLFESGGPSPEWSRLLLAADGKGPRILAPRGMRFRTADLVPGGLPPGRAGYVCVPLRFGDDRLGFLICTADSTDRRMYEALRDQVSSAMKGALLMAAERDRERDLESKVRARTLELSAANERLLEEMSRRKALERELLGISNRIMGDIGRDIHDNLCQDIAGLGIMAAVLEGQLRRSGEDGGAEAAAALARVAGETAAKAKGMARGLYPAELEAKGGLVKAVERLVEAAAARPGGEGPAVRMEKSRDFAVRDSEKALHLFRIVQEALGNALRHARASEIKVGLYMDRETVSVEVVDDGVGLPSLPREDPGMGLRILKYRASVIGGELRVRSLDRGTAVSCRAPR